MRTFIAVELGEEIRRRIEPIRQRLAQAHADVRWVDLDNMHLTLKFIGEIAPTLAPQVAEALRKAAEGLPSFEIGVGGVGTFPAGRAPRVVWLGIQDGSGRLGELASRIEKLLIPLGIPPENRAFRPHLTLGRVRSRKGTDELVNTLASMPSADAGAQPVDEVILFESRLTPQGPIYTRLATQKLG